MRDLFAILPDAEAVLALEPEELAGHILILLQGRDGHAGQFHLGNISLEFDVRHPNFPYYPVGQLGGLKQAFHEATTWLVGQGLIVPKSTAGDWKTLSRRARAFETQNDFRNFRIASRLPRESLDPSIAERVWGRFIRGEFGTAVFIAMRQVEIEVRDAGGYGDRVLGVDLMRAAFHPERGPLSDMAEVPAEREARMHLFAGSIGSYKNPHAHRDLNLDDPVEATEVIMLANHLLRIVDARRAAIAMGAPG